ncbi:uncharacterized protein LOC128736689 [Sabethes cyaneus]|uniref:uncharacterized protein LOC128736689 n=1 Tax=Sabethes cyaneus TaxID=53552 RepID=UPI00237D6D39|nr:uncharacterized protein LOC128736689 [Sabethes cyaneus]
MYASRTLPSAGEKRPADKQQSFIQRFYLFGTGPGSNSSPTSPSSSSSPSDSPGTPERPQPVKKAKKKPTEESEKEDSPPYSVQRLKQFWNNRLSLSANPAQPSEATLSRKLKSVNLSSASNSRNPATPEFLRRNGSTRGSATRRNIVRNSLIPLYSNLGVKKVASPKPTRVNNDSGNNSALQTSTNGTQQKRSSLVLSPVKDQAKEKRSCVERVGYNAGFPLVTATPTGGQINWARRVELFGKKPPNGTQEEQPKMPMKTENYVSNYIDVDIQNEPPPREETPEKTLVPEEKVIVAPPRLEPRDSLDSKKSSSSADTLSGRRHGTPTRKVSFRTTTSPFNRKLLHPSGNKVAALTNKFNKLIQQDAAILEEVRKRGGYLHKSGGHVYKVIDGDGNGSLRKKLATTTGGKSEESSDETAAGGKGSLRKTGVKKRPSLRKNLYRTPEWETNRTSLCVKEALEIFEPNHQQQLTLKADRKPPAGKAKPKVPDKSDQVIQKTKELKCKKSVQIEAKSCDSSKVENVALSEVPNSISEIESSISSENKSDEPGNTPITPMADDACETDGKSQAVEKDEKFDRPKPTPVTEKVPEYSVVKKRTETVKEAPSTTIAERLVEQSNRPKTEQDSKLDKIHSKSEEPKPVPAKSKSTVQKIYEKFTFRSTKKINLTGPARTSSESQLSTTSVASEDRRMAFPSENCLARKSYISSIEIPTIHIEEATEDSSDKKIVDAIRSLNQKIDNLSRSFNDLSLQDPEQETAEQKVVQPNNSFLYRSMTKISHGKETAVSQMNIVQAVNTVLINKSVSMDDHHFPCRDDLDTLYVKETFPTVAVSKPPTPIENDYELVSKVESPKKAETVSTRGSTMSIDIMELTAKIESFVYKAKLSDNNYQSVNTTNPHETVAVVKKPTDLDSHSVNSYESFENYESIERSNSQPPTKEEDTYEICNPPQPLPPRNECLTLPQPKRNLAGSPTFLPNYQPSYERIKYDKTPPRPPKPDEVPLPPRNAVPPFPDLTANREPSISPTLSDEPIYEENIYDTIRSCDGVDYDDPNGSGESAVIKRPKASLPPDAVSIVSSNCYESIGSKLAVDFLRHGIATLPRMGSISTLASDQITNSLYGCQTEVQSLTPPSERAGGGSDTSNSAEWTDISDDEDDEGSDSRRNNFIIVRKRNKAHQMPVWSRKVRHKWVSQQHQQEQLLQSDQPKLDAFSFSAFRSSMVLMLRIGMHFAMPIRNADRVKKHSEPPSQFISSRRQGGGSLVWTNLTLIMPIELCAQLG